MATKAEIERFTEWCRDNPTKSFSDLLAERDVVCARCELVQDAVQRIIDAYGEWLRSPANMPSGELIEAISNAELTLKGVKVREYPDFVDEDDTEG